jgi:PAS domain S-box-containing protein
MNESDLTLREKELRCLLDLSHLVEIPDIGLAEILKGTVQILLKAMEYPDIACARLQLMDQSHQTSNFKFTEWHLASPIKVHNQIQGDLVVCYLEERPPRDEGPFSHQKRRLVEAVAERIGRIAERIQTVEALAKSEKRLKDIFENSLVGVGIIQNGRTIYQNTELIRIVGEGVEAIGLRALSRVHFEDRPKVSQAFEALNRGLVPKVEIEYRFYSPAERPDTGRYKRAYCRAIRIDYHDKDAILVNLMDITPVKEMERLLRIQDKMSSLGRVAAGIAHEVRNPLSGINIYVDTLEKLIQNPGEEEQITRIVRQIKSASAKIENVIRRVYDFTKPSEPQLISADINKPAREAFELASVTLRKKNIRVDIDLAADLPPCRFDPQLIEQVLLNLITNAAEAIEQHPSECRIGIETRLHAGLVRITVHDSGRGVPAELHERIFEPFYTTKHGSSGIGLSITQRIIDDHGGTFSIDSGPWGGAAFNIDLPIAGEAETR